MSPHVVVPGAWEQEERNAAHKQQQEQQQQLAKAPGSSLEADLARQLSLGDSPLAQHTSDLRAAVAGCTEQQHLSSAADTPPYDPLSQTPQPAAATFDPLGADPLGAAAAGTAAGDAQLSADCAVIAAVAAAGAQSAGVAGEPEFTDPLRRRTLQGDEGLLGEGVGLSEDAMMEQEAQDAAALAALADLPRATQGLQLYDR
jgi:hypothetical protein